MAKEHGDVKNEAAMNLEMKTQPQHTAGGRLDTRNGGFYVKAGTGGGASEREDRGRGRPTCQPVLFSLSEFSKEGQGKGEIPRLGI